MTHKDEGRYREKHPAERKINERIAEAVKGRATNGEMPCAVAFQIVGELGVSPEEVGFTIDASEVKVVKCQLGLFGYRSKKMIVKPAESLSLEMEQAIKESLVNDKLSCKAAWDIAGKLGLRKMEISSACEALKVKISACQLGTF